jgi:hypothetical protein
MQVLRQRAGAEVGINLAAANDNSVNNEAGNLSSSKHINLFEDLEQVRLFLQ